MSPFENEDVMWERLKDIQRETENSRLLAESTIPGLVRLIAMYGERAWNLAGLAMRRPPRQSTSRLVRQAEKDRASRVA